MKIFITLFILSMSLQLALAGPPGGPPPSDGGFEKVPTGGPTPQLESFTQPATEPLDSIFEGEACADPEGVRERIEKIRGDINQTQNEINALELRVAEANEGRLKEEAKLDGLRAEQKRLQSQWDALELDDRDVRAKLKSGTITQKEADDALKFIRNKKNAVGPQLDSVKEEIFGRRVFVGGQLEGGQLEAVRLADVEYNGLKNRLEAAEKKLKKLSDSLFRLEEFLKDLLENIKKGLCQKVTARAARCLTKAESEAMGRGLREIREGLKGAAAGSKVSRIVRIGGITVVIEAIIEQGIIIYEVYEASSGEKWATFTAAETDLVYEVFFNVAIFGGKCIFDVVNSFLQGLEEAKQMKTMREADRSTYVGTCVAKLLKEPLTKLLNSRVDEIKSRNNGQITRAQWEALIDNYLSVLKNNRAKCEEICGVMFALNLSIERNAQLYSCPIETPAGSVQSFVPFSPKSPVARPSLLRRLFGF